MKLLRSVGSVLGSYVLCVVLVILSDLPLKAAFPREYADINTAPVWLLCLSTAIFFVISILCAWVCARTAPAQPGRHVLWFFALGEVMGIVSAVLNAGKVPVWFPIAWIVVRIPAVSIGWKLARRQSGAPAGPSEAPRTGRSRVGARRSPCCTRGRRTASPIAPRGSRARGDAASRKP